MGKKLGWFRRIFGGKRSSDLPKSSGEPGKKPSKDKYQWSFPSPTDNLGAEVPYTSTIDASRHAIVVAAATAAVAEAALAAAKAAAEVVRLTSGGAGRCTPTAYVNGNGRYWEVIAAIKIQSAFRAYLARRALRALKALVKLQALVRGHIVRKKTADTLRCMQALVRVQSRARANRTDSSLSSNKSSSSHHHLKYGSNVTTREIDLDKVNYGSKWLDRWMKENALQACIEQEETDKILEIDTWKPRSNYSKSNKTIQKPHHQSHLPSNHHNQPFSPFQSSSSKSKPRNNIPNVPFADSISLSSLMIHTEKDEATSYTAENSPQMLSGSSSRPGTSTRRSAFSPARSEFSRSFFNGYMDHPNYMSNTESYRAKIRSQSAPRQRIEDLEKYGSTRRSFHGGFSTRR